MRLGSYELLDEIGRGGMGRVYRARHVATGAVRAVKLLAGADPERVERFRREAEALARVGAGVAVPVHEAGSENGRTYYVMDLLPGGSLADRLEREGRLPWREAVALARTLALALERCHAAGLVHRDLKPANVLLDDAGAPRLADFGCARDLAAATLTATGELVGTPFYMAPEQLDGGRADARSDVYALGVVLHELLTGRRPYETKSWRELLIKMSKEPLRPIAAEVGAPGALDGVLARALALAPAKRTQAAAAFADELAALDTPGKTSRGPRRALVAALLVLGAIGAAATWRSDESSPVLPAKTIVRPAENDREREERVRRGEVKAGDLETLAVSNRELLRQLAVTVVFLPRERCVEAASHLPASRELAVLAAIATLGSSTDATERDVALDTIKRRGWLDGTLGRLFDAASRAAEVCRECESRRAQPLSSRVDGAALEPSLAPLEPALVGAATAGLASECRIAVLASRGGPAISIVDDVVSGSPSIGRSLGAVRPEIVLAYVTLAPQWRDGTAVKAWDTPAASDMLLHLTAAAEWLESRDPVLALHAHQLGTEHRWKGPELERDLAWIESHLESQSASDEKFVGKLAYRAARRAAIVRADDWVHASEAEKPAALERAIRAARLMYNRGRADAWEHSRQRDEEDAHRLALLLYVKGDVEGARAVTPLVPNDPLSLLLDPGTTVARVDAALEPVLAERSLPYSFRVLAWMVDEALAARLHRPRLGFQEPVRVEGDGFALAARLAASRWLEGR